MNKGWLELESDPGLFTLLVEDFGVSGIQVEEIYDLQKRVEGPVYGFIFLFKWIEERRARRKTIQEEDSFVTDESIVNTMFFAQQIIPNSCATHALLSVLLNCDNVNLGETLTKFKEFTQKMGSEDKGFAIGNMPDLARSHNRHARPEPFQLLEKQQGLAAVRTAEAFHFVSYVPVNGRLFELDGLKPHPIDHGPWGEEEDWTEKFRRVIGERLGMATNGGEPYHDIRFNLMAVVPDRRQIYEQKLKTLKTNRQIILETLQQMVKVTSDGDSPRTRQKSEPIVTRSVAAKEAAQKPDEVTGEGGVAIRSTRLREKAAAAAAAETMVRSPPELDSHNYAKSPEMQDIEAQEELANKTSSQETIEKFEKQQLQSVKNSDVKIQIAVSDDKEGGAVMHATTVASTDITKPLIIQTKFGNLPPGPGTGSSTDTASEVGSCLSSPVCSTGQTSPNVNPAAGHRAGTMATSGTNPESHVTTATTTATSSSSGVNVGSSTSGSGSTGGDGGEMSEKAIIAAATSLQTKLEESGTADEKPHKTGMEKRSSRRMFGSHAFTPKDLLQLLKNVESEITTCENNLRDEVDKHNKYKMDHCRRTHNYDQFICTFLSMLAEQGLIGSLVEPNMLGKRKAPINSAIPNKTPKKTTTAADKRKKARNKKKK